MGLVMHLQITNLIFFSSSTFKGCSVDLSVGIDISTPTRQVEQELQHSLPELMHRLAFLHNISCNAPTQINTMFRFLALGSNGQLTFDSGLGKLNNDSIQAFLHQQIAQSSHMNVDFLQSLGNRALHSSAKVKVIISRIHAGQALAKVKENTMVNEVNSS